MRVRTRSTAMSSEQTSTTFKVFEPSNYFPLISLNAVRGPRLFPLLSPAAGARVVLYYGYMPKLLSTLITQSSYEIHTNLMI